MISIPDSFRSAGLGRIAYHLWYRPAGAVRSVIAAGGPLEMRRTDRGRATMEATALQLAPTVRSGVPVELHLLTGQRFWYQTAFCLWTFSRNFELPLAPVVYDDGTLSATFRTPITRLFPATRFVSQAEILARLDQYLPADRFPVLRERWKNYPNIRKLTDVHAGASGWKLVLDSDLLFFRRPDFLAAWLARPDRPLHAVDCESSYGYSRALMNELAGGPVRDLVNVGLTGLRSEEIDWEQLEHWTRRLQAEEGTSYYLEQALIAMLVAKRTCAIAPGTDYVTLPREPESRECRATMHHYVANSKAAYFQRCWQIAMKR